ncbi:MAG: pyruvate ferredoxin oxidoreductase [Alphaproteobacteria bacterium]|nr:pyruvate ferredoxin oxidoreductase [Alphaproteobacteria bacterium]
MAARWTPHSAPTPCPPAFWHAPTGPNTGPTWCRQSKRNWAVDRELEIRLSGSGGQGLILAAGILAEALTTEGRNVAQSQSYEPTSRGGLSRSDLVVSDGEADYPLVSEIDCLVILDQVAVAASRDMIRPEAIVVTDAKTVTEPPAGSFRLAELPLSETAITLGNRRIANIVALSALTAMGGLCDRDVLKQTVLRRSPKTYVDLNMDALHAGWELAERCV